MIELNLVIPDWMAGALCAQVDPVIFFPDAGRDSAKAARSLCASCEVRDECLSFALEHDERFGIWGGTTRTQRDRLRRSAS